MLLRDFMKLLNKITNLGLLGAIASLSLILTISSTRELDKKLPIFRQLTADRITPWNVSINKIIERPYLGYGMDGYIISAPVIKGENNIIKTNPYSKAHNLIIDWLVSIGLTGTILYISILGYCLFLTRKSPLFGIGIVYLIFTMTWFESGQFTHIAWWSLSLFNYQISEFLTPNTNNFISNSDRRIFPQKE